MKPIIYFFLLLLTTNLFGKIPFLEKIETDSSNIEIIRNSIYRCYEETYKNKDSIWRSVSFIDDTTQLNTEGWMTKSDKYLGIWKEYNRKGELMLTWNHDNGVCIVNKSLYPYYEILEKMKAVADSIIISVYSKEFYEKHVQFDCECNAYDKDGYVGSWTEPMVRKPREMLFRYSVKLSKSNLYPEMIGLYFDSLGKYVPSYDDTPNRFGFEKVKGDRKTFKIDIQKATEIAQSKGLVISDSSEITKFLTWENLNKKKFYRGQFRYYITELTDKTEYTRGYDRKGIVYHYKVYTFNPWTGDFVKIKKMKSISEWSSHSGSSSGLMPDD